MPATPARLRQALRRLSEWPASESPVISAYLDLRPQATGNNPQVRSGQIVLRDRLREAERGLQPHTPAHDSFSADVERLNAYIENEALPAAQGLALFACHAEGRFEALDTALALDNDVNVGDRPRLVPLARLADDEQALVALADSNTLRLFASRSGGLAEIGLIDDEPDDYGKRAPGGWSQARFQRHVEEHRAQFADLAAEAIDSVAVREEASVIVLAGDEVALPLVRDRLPQRAADMVRGVLRLEMRATLQQVEDDALPFLEVVRAAAASDAADRLVGAVRSDGMAVAGSEATLRALELGQVMELIFDRQAELEPETVERLVREAAVTDARIRFADGHAGLAELGGVGGLVRFRVDREANQPPPAPGGPRGDGGL